MGIENKALELIEQIYDAALDENLWGEFLNGVVKAAKVSAGGVRVVRVPSNEMPFYTVVGYDPSFLQSYREYYIKFDPIIPRLVKRPNGTILVNLEENLVDLRRSEIFNDWVKPQGFAHSLAVGGDQTEGMVSGMTFWRSEKEGPFLSEDIRLFRILAPHLVRAFAIKKKLGGLESGLAAAQSALDRLSVGLILIDGEERAVYLNRRAEEIVRQGDGLAVRHKKVTASEVGEAERLRKLIHEAVLNGQGVAAHSGGDLLLNRHANEGPLRVLVCPIHSRRQNLGFRDGQVCAAVFITAPGEDMALPGEVLQTLYGLTPAETGIALELAKGRSLDAIADEKGVTKNTARNQLKAVFHKTGTHRQNQLVNLLLTDPAAIVK